MGPKRKAGARSKATAKPLPLQPPTAPQQPALTAASFASSQLFVRWIGQLEGPVEEGSSAGGLFTQHKMALASRFNHELKWLASYAQELEAGMASGQV